MARTTPCSSRRRRPSTARSAVGRGRHRERLRMTGQHAAHVGFRAAAGLRLERRVAVVAPAIVTDICRARSCRRPVGRLAEHRRALAAHRRGRTRRSDFTALLTAVTVIASSPFVAGLISIQRSMSARASESGTSVPSGGICDERIARAHAQRQHTRVRSAGRDELRCAACRLAESARYTNE